MSDKLFIIPQRDEDLFLESEAFNVEKTDVNQQEIEANLEEYSSNLSSWWDILEYFPHFFYTITQPSTVSKEIILRSQKQLAKGLSRLTDTLLATLPDYLNDETPDERIVINVNRVRASLSAYIYLLSRLGTILEGEIVKSTNIEKKGKNAAHDTFYDDVVKSRRDVVNLFESLITAKDDNVSIIKQLYSPNSIPDGFPRVVAHFIIKKLSVPENGLVRSEMRQHYPAFFHILGFMGFEWSCMRGVVSVLLEKLHTWEYFKKVTTFIFIQPILELNQVYCDSFLDAILSNFVSIKWANAASADKVRPFSLFIMTLAEKNPDFIDKNFQSFYKFLKCDQHLIRCAVLSALEAVIIFYLRQNIQEEKHEFIFKLFHEMQFFFWDPSSYVRIRAASVVNHIISETFLEEDKEIIGDKTKRRFSTDFYAFNIIEKYAVLLSDSLVSVRKNAVQAVAEILHRNPFGADLDFNKLVIQYNEIHEAKEKVQDIPDNDDNIVAKATEGYEKLKETVANAVAEYFEFADFPEPLDEPEAEDAQYAHYISLATDLDEAADKKSIIFQAVEYCLQNGSFEPDSDFMDQITEFIASKFYIKNMTSLDTSDRQECIVVEQQNRVDKIKEDYKRQEHVILSAIQFALQMEECMKRAIIALKHGQMGEINEIVKFLATCRKFRLRESESAVMQICSLIYRNDAEIREYVVKAGKEIFFSANSNESVSEKSTVQNLMQVMLNAKLEDRCVLADTLVYIFKSEPLKAGSLHFLWETAEKDAHLAMSLVAIQILQPYVKAVPTEGQKNFSRLIDMLKRPNEEFQIEVLLLASCCGTVISATETNLKDLLAPRFRIPSSDKFFQLATKELIANMTTSQSQRWNQRAKLTLEAVYELCETPDEFCNDLIGSIVCQVKDVNLEFRTFRYLHRESLKIVSMLRQKLREKNLEMVPTYSITEVDDYKLQYIQVTDDLANFSLTQENILDATMDTTNENIVLLTINPYRGKECINGYNKYMKRKRRRTNHCSASTDSKELKWLKRTGKYEEFASHFKLPKQCSIKHIKSFYQQTNDLFVKCRELGRQWHLLLKRLFFLTQQYIVRSISFIHEAMTGGFETLTKTLSDIRKLSRGQVTMENLPKWTGEVLSPFERDNLADLSIFQVNKGRMADATDQSVDAVVSAQVESAIGWDFFRPGSLLIRVWPIAVQTLKFRSRPLISVALADSAIYCLIKYMLASPNICRRNLSFIFYYLRTAKPETRSNIIIMLADIAIRHPSTFSKHLNHYLIMIYDNNPNVRYTSLLMIYYLNTVKAVQLSGSIRAYLAILLIDQNQFISDMAKHFFHEVVTSHHIQISSVINDVLLRLHTLKIKDFDFKPIAEFFFAYIDTVKEAEHTMATLCKQLIATANNRESPDEHDKVFADQLVACMKLVPKISFHVVNTIDKSVDKFKNLLVRKSFRKLMNELVVLLIKRCHLKPEIKNEVEIMKKHLENAHNDVVAIARYCPKKVTRTRTVEVSENEEPMQVD